VTAVTMVAISVEQAGLVARHWRHWYRSGGSDL